MANFKVKAFLDDDGNPIATQQEEAQETEETQDQTEETQDEGTEEQTQESEDSSADTDDTAGEETDEQETQDLDEEESTEEEESQGTVNNDDQEVVDYDELPEVVQKFLDMYEDTGGAATLEDFLFVNQDFSKLDQDDVIRRYLKQQNPALDAEDIAFEMEERFGFDADTDDDRDIRRKKVDKKKFYGEALRALEDQKKKYGADLASRQKAQISPEAVEAVEFKKRIESERAEQDKIYQEVRSSFIKQTNKELGKDFKGFEVKVGDETLSYKPGDLRKIKEQNLDVNNLLSKFLDKRGGVKDVVGYHRALAFASDPDGVAKHFYELGRAAAIEEEAKEGKGFKQAPRKVQEAPKPKNAPKFRFLSEDENKNSKIRLKDY